MKEKMNSSKQSPEGNPWDTLSEEHEDVDGNPLGLKNPALIRLRQKLNSMNDEERKAHAAKAIEDQGRYDREEARREYEMNRDFKREIRISQGLEPNELTEAEKRAQDKKEVADQIERERRSVMEALRRGERPD